MPTLRLDALLPFWHARLRAWLPAGPRDSHHTGPGDRIPGGSREEPEEENAIGVRQAYESSVGGP